MSTINDRIDDRGAVMLARFGVLIRTGHVAIVAMDDLSTGLRVLERYRREGRTAPVTEAEWAAITPAVAVMEARLNRVLAPDQDKRAA